MLILSSPCFVLSQTVKRSTKLWNIPTNGFCTTVSQWTIMIKWVKCLISPHTDYIPFLNVGGLEGQIGPHAYQIPLFTLAALQSHYTGPSHLPWHVYHWCSRDIYARNRNFIVHSLSPRRPCCQALGEKDELWVQGICLSLEKDG